MIKKLYVCDLCGNDQPHELKNGEWNSVRLKWNSGYGGEVIELRPLGDSSASEKIICAVCIAQLHEALVAACLDGPCAHAEAARILDKAKGTLTAEQLK